ncbi:hypothetical protein [Flammeovirga kamogawensis]|uniref:Beta-lactamase-inhibitor-like PepSY-like domain-containing protein n=1 Tax=Flammeovirga kamogawensis TaxID=373891 RepID=A0ABX8H2B0_9BACT|nr:hypothetical protein [Flammeovirga kamogawensis]MBB6463621.1 hypothetical protein [Flammeovirga kamogawensis]QWG09843.1 hypothetical protein KM029_19375 [Flammeovirga kamogawensis]TRX65350.1 hypothetical protein EO216_22770 [Flammeovirga kamogawensis]
MKHKFLFFIAAFIGLSSLAMAQKAVLKVKEVNQSEVDGTIYQHINEEFPEGFVDYVNIIPVALIQKDYEMVYHKKPVLGLFSKTYEVYVKTENGTEKIYLDKEGKIVLIKRKIDNVQLPEYVLAKVNKDFPDWTVVGASEKIEAGFDHGKEVYRVFIIKGKDKKDVYLTGHGEYTSK